MTRTLFIRIDPTASEATWQLVDNGQLAGPFGHGDLSGARRAANGSHVIVLLPSEEIFLTNAILPGKNRKKLIKALPYVVEDQLVDNVDELHFVLGHPSENGQYLVAAVERKLMDYWDKALKAAGIRADEMVPDVSALLATSDDWTILLEQDRALVRGTHGMFASDIHTLPVMLTNLYQQSEDNKPEQITVYDCSRVDHVATLQEQTEGLNFNVLECTESIFSVFARQYSPKLSINLLQGEYSHKEHVSKQLKPWIPAAALFCIWISWQLVLNVGEYLDLSARSDQLTNEMRRVYSSAFPNSKPPSPGYERAYMEKQLNELLKRQGKSSGSLQEILSKSASTFKNISGLEINGIQYSGGNLTLELTMKQASEIENLKERLSSQTGFKITSQATTEKGITKVRLKISGSNS